jgi:hypothetical protein
MFYLVAFWFALGFVSGVFRNEIKEFVLQFYKEIMS